MVIDGYRLADLVVAGSSNPDLRSRLPLIIDDLARGDGMQAARALLPGHTPAGAMGYGLLYGVQCSEYVPFTSPDELVDVGQRALPGALRSVVEYPPPGSLRVLDLRHLG